MKENMKTDLRDYSRKNSNKSEESTDPLIVLDTFSSSLNNHGGLKDAKEVEIITTIMKNSSKLVGKFMCLYVLQVTDAEVLESFVRNGGWGILNKYLAHAKDSSNVQLQAEIMKLIQILPLKIDHLKENNTAKLVKSLSKSTNKGIKVAASSLMEKFMNVIHGTTNSNTNEIIPLSKKMKLKEKLKSKSIKHHDNNNKERKHSNETKSVPVSQVRSKFRKTGLEESSEPTKKKGKLDKRIPLKRNSGGGNESEMPADKKNKTDKPTPPEKQKKITISGGFMDALNSLPQVPQKRVKRKTSRPTNNPAATNPANNNNKQEVANDDPVSSPEKEEEKKPEEPSKPKLNRFGKPMKSVTWHPEDRLTAVRYFEVLDNERVNVTTQSFKESMLREHMFERQNLKGNKVADGGDRSWRKPHPLDLQDSLAERGSKSIEKEVQREREKTVLQVIYLYKENVPDSPMEPDPEPYEVVQPPVIPLVDVNNPDEEESSQPDNKNILTAFSDNVANSNVGDLKEKLKEILQTASAITPGSNPPQAPLPPQQPMQPMYNNQMHMGMMPPPNMNMPPPPGGFYPMPPMAQNYNNPPQWQQPQYPPMPPQQHHQQYRPYNNHQRPPWNNRGRPRHAR